MHVAFLLRHTYMRAVLIRLDGCIDMASVTWEQHGQELGVTTTAQTEHTCDIAHVLAVRIDARREL